MCCSCLGSNNESFLHIFRSKNWYTLFLESTLRIFLKFSKFMVHYKYTKQKVQNILGKLLLRPNGAFSQEYRNKSSHGMLLELGLRNFLEFYKIVTCSLIKMELLDFLKDCLCRCSSDEFSFIYYLQVINTQKLAAF